MWSSPFDVNIHYRTNDGRSPTWTQSEAEADSALNAVGEGQYPIGSLHSHEQQQSLVIEDYYCVSVQPADQETPAGSTPLDSNERDPPIQANPVDEQSVGHSSLISEGEGPAQWLAAPKAGPERVEDLAMEPAGESSDSEGQLKVQPTRPSSWIFPNTLWRHSKRSDPWLSWPESDL